jgi:hypothetical protein
MKKDTLVNMIDLDDILNPKTEKETTPLMTESVQHIEPVAETVAVDWDEIITEWFYRLPKGYADQPYTESELKVLDQVIMEYKSGGFKPVIKEDRASNDMMNAIEAVLDTLRIETGFSDNILSQIRAVFLKLSTTEQKAFLANFRNNTLDTFIKGGYKTFTKFFSIVPTNKAAGGMGRGEVMCILGIKNSRSGGNHEHDVIIGSSQFELKQLADGSFDPAKYAVMSRFSLTTDINQFYKNLVLPYNRFEIREDILSLVDKSDVANMTKILDIFEAAFPEQTKKGKDLYMGNEISYSIFNNWYLGFTALSKLLNKTMLRDLPQSRVNLKGNVDKTFWINNEDSDSIIKAKPDSKVTITVGDEITDENSYAVIWLQNLIQSKFIVDPEYIIDELREIRNGFWDEIAGLIYFNGDDTTPLIGKPEQFAATHITRGQYRIGLKTKYTKYNHTQIQ